MDSNMAHYDAAGMYDKGLHHRAIMVARALYQAGMWDGQQLITIIDPDQRARELDLYNRPVTSLQAGKDYQLGQ